jgi:hypothetical protein
VNRKGAIPKPLARAASLLRGERPADSGDRHDRPLLEAPG